MVYCTYALVLETTTRKEQQEMTIVNSEQETYRSSCVVVAKNSVFTRSYLQSSSLRFSSSFEYSISLRTMLAFSILIESCETYNHVR